jgi:hypothetical protein
MNGPIRLKTCKRELGGLIVGSEPLGFVAVDARLGLLRDRVVDGDEEFQVRRGRGGWRGVVDPAGTGRVRYDGWRDRIQIESPAGSLRIQFRWRNTTFTWQGRTYRIGSGFWSRVRIFDGEREVAGGKVTLGGFRFEFVVQELRAVERELAIGLGLRAQTFAALMTAAQ